MKKIPYLIISVVVTASVMISVYAADNFGARGAKTNDDPSLQEMLTYALQDEYLARAEYEKIIVKFGSIRPFSNIIKSEETHINLLLPLFDNYRYTIPADTSSKYVEVPRDIKTALEIGVQAEIDNIAMYESFLSTDIPADVFEVFKRLKAASENHLRAFQNGLKRYQ